MKKILSIAVASLLAFAAWAADNVHTKLNGVVEVGTSVYAGPGGSVAQTATGGLSAFTVVGTGEASYTGYTLHTPATVDVAGNTVTPATTTEIPGVSDAKTVVVNSSITGFAGESHTIRGNAGASGYWVSDNGKPVNAVVQGYTLTTIKNFTVPVTYIGGKDSLHDDGDVKDGQ